MAIPESIIAEVTALYDRGLYLQAYAVAQKHGTLTNWLGTAARLIGGRLAGNLGGRHASNWLHLRAWLADHRNPEAAYFCGASIHDRRGPLAAWKFLERLPAFAAAEEEKRANLLTLRARTLAQFRDFTRAEALLREAERLGANQPWVCCERASIEEMQDHYDAALAAAEQALALRPWYRPAVQQAAHLRQLVNRDEEAAALLREALTRIESGACAAQLAAVCEELGEIREAISAWEQARTLSPLFDEKALHAWHGRMADLLYRTGAHERAAEHARLAQEKEFYEGFAERLSAPGAITRRVHLPVGFVRQHHVTCAPATLTALGNYFGQAVDHLALAREITYDGTPDHIERAWAERSGFVVREFRVTWESARALLDRDVPFTLTTVEVSSGHLQAVIGYDLLRETLIIRDPYQRGHSEFRIHPLLERYAPFGPRGMVMVPTADAARLDGAVLPDVEFFDAYYRVRRATHDHQRDAAAAALAELERLDATHRLTHFARRELAYYDGQVPQQLAETEELLARYPKTATFLHGKASALRELTRREEVTDFLRQLASEDVDPSFWRAWAEELNLDARRRPAARRTLLRVLHVQPLEAGNLTAYASLLWDERDFTEATRLYRLAACLRDTADEFSRSYFLAARHCRETETALTWLRDRVARHGTASSQPARMLFWALSILDRTEEAFVVLEAALAARPEDGDLLLHAVDAFARHGQTERADALLAAAEPRTRRATWLRTAASLADFRADLPRALALWREVLAAEPLAPDAQSTTVRLVAEVEGRTAAHELLGGLAARFPHHVPLHRLWVEWSRFDGPIAWESIARRVLAIDAGDAWTRRELALALSDQGRFDEALVESATSRQIEPQNSIAHGVHGRVLLQAGRLAEARAALEQTLRLSIDSSHSLRDLLAASPTQEEKLEAADFVRGELTRQVVFGDGLLAYREHFFDVLEPAMLLANLREAHAARPDLWHAWSALGRQLADMREMNEALAVGREETERFPLVPGSWTDLAATHRQRGERAEEIAALQRALALNPSWTFAARQLAEAHEARGEFAEARQVIERAIASAPLEAANHGMLAAELWRDGARTEALDRLALALQHDPDYDWGWNVLADWTARHGEPERAEAVARQLTQTRAGEARGWVRLAQILPAERADERLAALDRAVALDPKNMEAHDARAELLAQQGRFEEAIAACAPAAFDTNVPVNLRGRAAWIEALRGHLPQALEQMRAVVRANPGYYWGWTLIAQWALESGAHEEARAAAETLVRLAPRSPVPLGHLAQTQLRLNRPAEALETLRRAFDLDPTYAFAGFNLFQHQLEAADYRTAEATLQRLQTHLPGAETTAARVRLAAKQRREEDAFAAFRELCISPAQDDYALRQAADAVVAAGWGSRLQRVLSEMIEADGANPEVGALWAERFTARHQWKYRNRLYDLDPRTPLGQRARFAYLAAIGEQRQAAFLKKLLKRDRTALHEHTATWGQTGYAFAACGEWREVIGWLHDWRERRGAQPWMLSNLALALRHEGRESEAQLVNEQALHLPADGTTAGQHAWLALSRACENNAAEAQRHLEHAGTQAAGTLEYGAKALAEAIVNMNTRPAEERRGEFRAQRRRLKDPAMRAVFSNPILRDLSQRGVQCLADAAGERPFRLGSSRASSFLSEKFNGLPAGSFWVIWILFMVLVQTCSRLGSTSSQRASGTPRSQREARATIAPVPVDPWATPKPFLENDSSEVARLLPGLSRELKLAPTPPTKP